MITVSFTWGLWLRETTGLQMAMVLLTLYLVAVCILISLNSITHNVILYFIVLSLLAGILCLAFTTENILVFYICFEATLIPMFLMVLGWGARSQKMRAAFYLFFFTLISSLMMLLSLVKLYALTGSLYLGELRGLELPYFYQK